MRDRTVILVDDGIATGATMRAVAAPKICHEFQLEVNKIMCTQAPRPFNSVGLWYENFLQTTNAEVRNLLQRAAERKSIASL